MDEPLDFDKKQSFIATVKTKVINGGDRRGK